jgi:hypothetical protein
MSKIEPAAPKSLSNQGNPGLKLVVGILVLAALTFGVYYPALRTQLVADDFYLVGQITFSDAMTYFTKTFGFGRNEYRPITALSFAVDRGLWHERPDGYHLTNLLLHAVTAGLLFLILDSLTADFALALLASCIFVIHPINEERVIWISARDGPVCAVFLLGAIWLFVLSRRQNRRTLRVIAVGFAGCALLAYEGAVILPALIFGVEFIFFATGSLRSRIMPTLGITGAFWALAAAYICLWQITFSGAIGAYDLALAPLNILENYGRLLSTLFYGQRRWVFGLTYLILFASSYRMLRAGSRLTAFALVLIIISFVPYCFTHGFGYRFGYFSALGMGIILAACIMGGFRSVRRLQQQTAACIGVILCVCYALEDRKILAEWTSAGEIAAAIPRAVRKLYPHLPNGAVLVFTNIPRAYGKAYLFPNGLDAAIQREYPLNVIVRKYEKPLTDLRDEERIGAFVFGYRGGTDPLRELSAPTSMSTQQP